MSLEQALADHVASAVDSRSVDERRLGALLDRLGLRGTPPVTLTVAGQAAGVSGERIRQLELRVRRSPALGRTQPLPQLDAALQAVADEAPMPCEQVPALLQRQGIADGQFSLESLLSAAELWHRKIPFAPSGTGDEAVVLPAAAAKAMSHADAVRSVARRQTDRRGASTLKDLAGELSFRGMPVTARGLRMLLGAQPRAVLQPDGWFWFTDASGSGSFAATSRRMLAVTSPLPVASLRDGLRRQQAHRRRPPPPPVSVLARVYADHPSFEVCSDLVAAIEPVCPELIGPATRRILDLLWAAPGQMLARHALIASCHEEGINLSSLCLYLSYSECLERVRPGVFAPRGAAAGDPPPQPPRRRRAPSSGGSHPAVEWTDDGRVRITVRLGLNTLANGVVHVPGRLASSLADSRFACTDADGQAVTTLAIDAHGNSWGWMTFARRAGAGPDAVVVATLDPATGTGVLQLAARA